MILFHSLVLTGFLACLGLKFPASGCFRGNLYDLLLVFVLASATFSTLNPCLLKAAGAILSYIVNPLLYR